MRAAPVSALTITERLEDGQAYRKLGWQERSMHVIHEESQPFGCGAISYSLVVDSQRRLEAQHVQMALVALQRQVPILRARVEEREDGHLMVASDAQPRLTELPPGGDWLEHHLDRANTEQVLNCPNGPHWTVAFMREPRNTIAPQALPHRAVLYVTIAHTFTDDVSSGRMFGQLVQNLDQALQNGEVEERPAAPVYPCAEDMLEKVSCSGSRVWALLKTAWSMFRNRKATPFLKAYVTTYDGGPLEDHPCRLETTSLAPDDLSRLHSKCRQHGVTVNAAISAAVSIAAARMLAEAADSKQNPGPCRLRTSFIVNLRRYLPPEVDTSQFYGCAVGFAGSHIKVPSTSTDNFWPVASNIHASLQRQIKMRMPVFLHQIVARFSKPERYEWEKGIEKATRKKLQLAEYNINNIGNLDAAIPHTEAVRMVELHRTLRQHPALDQTFGWELFQTVGGRLFYDLNYIGGRVQPEDAQRLQTLVMAVLQEVAAAID